MRFFQNQANIVDPGDFEIPQTPLSSSTIDNVVELALAVAAGIAFIVLVLAGFKYVRSRGNASDTAKAKNAIIYSLIGLVITMTAYSIVALVVNKV